MNDRSDQQLLQEYAHTRSEAAFAELVGRHLDLVYSAALRRIGDPHLAQDITQGAFTALAQNASRLTQHPVLSGWLHRTTQNLAANLIRANQRRQHREQEAATMNQLLSAAASNPDWQTIAPHLDAALDELDSHDRDLVLLRYFEKKSARETAVQLGISDEAAQKRISRAVERLREFLAKRGVTAGASGLAVVISTNAVQAAPVGLALTISTAAALTGTTLATSATITATKAIAMTALQKTVVAATIAVLVGAGIYEARQASQLREQVQLFQQQQVSLIGQINSAQAERDNATNRLALLIAETQKLTQNNNELMRLRGEVSTLRRSAKEQPHQSGEHKPTDELIGQNILNYAVIQMNKDGTNSVNQKIERLTSRLNLTTEQQESLRNMMLAQVEPQTQITLGGYRKELSPEETRLRGQKIANELNLTLAAVLTPDQQAAHEQMKIEEANEAGKAFASRELAIMKFALKISPEQADQATVILTGLKTGAGGPGVATDYATGKKQLELRCQALATVLSPKQLDDYRQLKLKSLEQIEQQNQEVTKLFKVSR